MDPIRVELVAVLLKRFLYSRILGIVIDGIDGQHFMMFGHFQNGRAVLTGIVALEAPT